MAEAIGQAIGRVVKERCAELEAQIDGLRSEMKEFTFKGAFQESRKYKRGNFCSQGGAVYYCAVDTTTRPGTDDKAVPRARDGRDGKDFVPPEAAQRTTRSHR